MLAAADASAVVVNQVVFSDQDYADSDWTIVNQFGLVSAGQQPTGGNPGSYRQVVLAVGQDVPFVGQLSRRFVYDPSTQGAITGITYRIDLETTDAEGAGYFALISQGGNYYLETQHTGNATPNTWLTENIVLDLSDFVRFTISPAHTFVVDANSHPDFSSNGSPMTFGYEVTAEARSSPDHNIDNDPIILTVVPSAVPEPLSDADPSRCGSRTGRPSPSAWSFNPSLTCSKPTAGGPGSS
jgi:hypothetical protein